MILRISNDEVGSRAILISVDEGDGQVPATTVDQKTSTLTVVLKRLSGVRYIAEINKEGSELKGALTMGNNDIPPQLKKTSATAH